MRRTLLVLLTATLLAVTLGSCTSRQMKRLSPEEFDHFYALRPFLSEEQRDTFLKFKTEEERTAFLKEAGVWDYFYKYTAEEREEILSGNVAVGWPKDWLLMAWGGPYDKQSNLVQGSYSRVRYVYRFEEHEDGRLIVWEAGSKTEYNAVRLFQRDVIIDKDVVVEINEQERWEQ